MTDDKTTSAKSLLITRVQVINVPILSARRFTFSEQNFSEFYAIDEAKVKIRLSRKVLVILLINYKFIFKTSKNDPTR